MDLPILGVIPARGGSKGLPRKNLRQLCGKPLIVWSIEAAQSARLLDRFVVSTEDDDIAAVAELSGAEVLRRPAELATDDASTLAVLLHAITVIPARIVVVLQPTSPVRDHDLIDRCIERFQVTAADSLATGFICKYAQYGQNQLRRQDLAGFFYDDGNVYVIDSRILSRGDRFGTRREHYLTDREQNIDIDDDFDLFVAEQVLRRRNAEGAGAEASYTTVNNRGS